MKFLPDSVRSLLAVLFGGLALVVGLPTYLYLEHVYEKQLISDRGNAIRELGAAAAAVVTENLSERQREIELLAKTPLFRRAPLDSADLGISLEQLQTSYPHYSWIGLADTESTVRASTGKLLLGASVGKRPWYIQGVKGPFLGDLHEALLLSKLLPQEPGQGPMRFIDFAAPVLDDQGALRGVLGAHAHWQWAGDVIRVMMPRNAAQTALDIFIVNANGQVIYPDRSDAVKLPAALTGQQPFVLDNWGGSEAYVTAMVPVRDLRPDLGMGWRIVVRQPAAQTLADVNRLKQVLLQVALLSALVFLALAWWTASLISRPLQQLAQAAQRIEQGHEHTTLDVSTNSIELRHLVAALRGMAATLISRKDALAQSNLHLEQKVAERTAELARANDELRQLARRDALTRLANRLAANERLHEEFVRLKRSKIPYVVLLMDIDFFKRVNDTYGHPVGDAVLQHTANCLTSAMRESDFIARFGGEEFLALLPATGFEAACRVAEKVRLAVASSPAPTAGRITISIGMALASSEQTDENEAVRKADDWLYEAKKAGRNRLAAEGIG